MNNNIENKKNNVTLIAKLRLLVGASFVEVTASNIDRNIVHIYGFSFLWSFHSGNDAHQHLKLSRTKWVFLCLIISSWDPNYAIFVGR